MKKIIALLLIAASFAFCMEPECYSTASFKMLRGRSNPSFVRKMCFGNHQEVELRASQNLDTLCIAYRSSDYGWGEDAKAHKKFIYTKHKNKVNLLVMVYDDQEFVIDTWKKVLPSGEINRVYDKMNKEYNWNPNW